MTGDKFAILYCTSHKTFLLQLCNISHGANKALIFAKLLKVSKFVVVNFHSFIIVHTEDNIFCCGSENNLFLDT